MLRSKWLITGSAAILLIVAAAGGVYWKLSQPKACTNDCNVILISVDSMRLDHMGVYGYKKYPTTPNLDKLAKKSFVFDNYFSAGYLTPVSEGAVQSGMYPTTNTVKSFFSEVPSDVKILPQYMKSLGFYTQSIISSPEFTTYPPLKKGFSKGYDKYNFSEDDVNPNALFSNSRKYPPIRNFRDVMKENIKQKQKSFTWLAIGGVHWPYGQDVPNQFGVTYYQGILGGKPLDWPLFQSVYKGYLYPDKKKLTKGDYDYINDRYDNGVYAFDNYLGQVLDQLKQLKLDKKTIIILESEHGEGLGEHGYYAHYDIMDTQVHEPLVIYDPRLPGGKRIKSIVGSVDVLPTILDLVDAKTNNKLQGKSIKPILNGQEKDGQRQETYIERVPLWEEGVLQVRDSLRLGKFKPVDVLHEDYAIRTSKWKYILRDSAPTMEKINYWQDMTKQKMTFPPEELYDMQSDPSEQKNVAAQNPEVVKQLKAKLIKWRTESIKDRPTQEKKTEMVQPYL